MRYPFQPFFKMAANWNCFYRCLWDSPRFHFGIYIYVFRVKESDKSSINNINSFDWGCNLEFKNVGCLFLSYFISTRSHLGNGWTANWTLWYELGSFTNRIFFCNQIWPLGRHLVYFKVCACKIEHFNSVRHPSAVSLSSVCHCYVVNYFKLNISVRHRKRGGGHGVCWQCIRLKYNSHLPFCRLSVVCLSFVVSLKPLFGKGT